MSISPSTVTVESTRFGTLQVDPAAIVEFPAGLAGLGGTRYAMLMAGTDGTFMWLQSVEDPGVALPVCNPFVFFPDYGVELGDEDVEQTGIADPSRCTVWVTVRAGERPEENHVNLKAPILIYEGRAYQVINEAPDAPLRAPMFPAKPKA